MSIYDDETTAASLLAEQQEPKEKKQSLLKTIKNLNINEIAGTAQSTMNNVNEFYGNWIKPVYDNRMQIARRLNALSLVFSIIYFILYIPFLLFGKIADGLSLGREIALYVCLGTYVVALVVMLVVYLTLLRSQSTKTSAKYKRTMKVFLYVVRIASVAISITALVITTTAQSEVSSALTTLGIVFAIISIIFSALPLLFGGFKGLFKWLISPVKIKYHVRMVALEWFQQERDANIEQKKKQKYIAALSQCVDETVVPKLGDKVIKSVTTDQLNEVIEGATDPDFTAYVINKIFAYAKQSGYITENPCDELQLPEEVPAEEAPVSKIRGLLGRFGRGKRDED